MIKGEEGQTVRLQDCGPPKCGSGRLGGFLKSKYDPTKSVAICAISRSHVPRKADPGSQEAPCIWQVNPWGVPGYQGKVSVVAV